MIRTFHPGAWFGEILPSGAYAVLFPHDRVETHRGALPVPAGDPRPFGPRYVRITDVGGVAFAGQADDGKVIEWREGSGWRRLEAFAIGVSPVIYDRLGILHISDGSIGSQGWRFCQDDSTPEGRLVTGDQTYRREVAPGISLYEYTDLGPVLIGQGQEDGIVVWDGITLRLLESGHRTFIRANTDGVNVAIACKTPDGVVLFQTTLAELAALPPVTNSGTTVPNPGTPAPSPEPEPVPMPIPSQLSTVQAVRAQYPTPLGAQHARFLIHVATATGARLLRKDGGTHIVLPSGRRVSQDIIVIAERLIDILADGEGAAVPVWDDKEDLNGRETYDPASEPQAPKPEPPKDEPTPQPSPSVDLAAILARIDLMEKRQDAANAETHAALLKLAESIEKWKAPPIVFPPYESQRLSLIGTITLRPKP